MVEIVSAASRSSSSPSINAEIRSFMPPPAFPPAPSLPSFVLPRIEERAQALGDRFSRAEDARAHGADRAIHGLRDFLVAHALDLAHLNRLTKLLWQVLDCRVNGRREA